MYCRIRGERLLCIFAATDSDHGEELWVTDGTAAGTKMVKDINPGISTSNVCYLTRFNDKVVFSATDGENGEEVWISDGTEAGTYMVKDIHELESSNPVGFSQLDETRFIFFAMDFESENYSTSGSQKWLYVSDGTAAGTSLVKQLDVQYPGEDNDNHSPYNGPVVRSGRKVFFKADVADKSGWTYGYELWVTDGTADGTFMVKDINVEQNLDSSGNQIGTRTSAVDHITNFYNEGVFFKAWDEEHGNEPWFSDGTEAGTYLIYDTNPNKNESGIGIGGGATMVGDPYNGEVCFRGYTPEGGNEFAATNCQQGNFKFFDIFSYEPTASNNSYADNGVVFDNLYMFCAATGFDASIAEHRGGELHWYDGTQVQMQYDFAPGTGCDWVKEPIVVGGSMYWWNEGNMDGTTSTDTKLIRLNAWNAVPEIISNIDANGDKVYCLRNLNGSLLFTSSVNNQLYCYTYRQDGYDATKNPDDMTINFLTRDESGVEDVAIAEKAALNLTVYPNPATESFSVKGAENVAVQVYDIAGRLVLSTTTNGETISVSGLAAGFYKVVADGKTASLIVK